MTTQYSMGDTLPKDAGGAKFSAWIDDAVSALDFGLPRGIASETLGGTSKILAHLAVGSHTIASKVENLAPGTLLLGAYTEAPSGIGTGNAQAIRADSEGAMYVRPASGITSWSQAPSLIHVTGSALLHGIEVALTDVNAGQTVEIGDGTGNRLNFIVQSAGSVNFSRQFTTGLHFGTDIRHINSAGPAASGASVTIIYSQF